MDEKCKHGTTLCIMNSTDPESRDVEELESGTSLLLSLNTMGPRLRQGPLLQYSQCFWGPGASHELSKGHFWLPAGGGWGCLKQALLVHRLERDTSGARQWSECEQTLCTSPFRK